MHGICYCYNKGIGITILYRAWYILLSYQRNRDYHPILCMLYSNKGIIVINILYRAWYNQQLYIYIHKSFIFEQSCNDINDKSKVHVVLLWVVPSLYYYRLLILHRDSSPTALIRLQIPFFQQCILLNIAQVKCECTPHMYM